MEKRLLDYAQYYIGCRCLNTWFPESHPEHNNDWTLVGVCVKHGKPYKLENNDSDTSTNSIKLILRKLQSLSDDEWGIVITECSLPGDLLLVKFLKSSFFSKDNNDRYYWTVVNKALNSLRRLSVDVDGLIESGLAIDAATLPK